MIKTILLAIMLLVASSAITAAEDAPSAWMEQDEDTIKLMVNTSDDSGVIQLNVNFESANINITDVDFTGCPWLPFSGEPGWNNTGSQVIIALLVTPNVLAGEYQIAEMSVDCITVGETLVTLTDIVLEGTALVPIDLTYICPEIVPPVTDAIIAIGDGTGDVTLPITVVNAGNVGAVDVTLTYDPAVVMVTGVAGGDMDYTGTNIEYIADGWIRIGAMQTANPGLDNFTLLDVTLAPQATGTSCPLTLTVTTFKEATPEGAEIAYVISSGTYTTLLLGDVDGSGDVTMSDATYLIGYLIGCSGYEIINEAAADINGDGIVDVFDAMYLAKQTLSIPGF
jgi:hypothetical protein